MPVGEDISAPSLSIALGAEWDGVEDVTLDEFNGQGPAPGVQSIMTRAGVRDLDYLDGVDDGILAGRATPYGALQFLALCPSPAALPHAAPPANPCLP